MLAITVAKTEVINVNDVHQFILCIFVSFRMAFTCDQLSLLRVIEIIKQVVLMEYFAGNKLICPLLRSLSIVHE